VNCAIARHSLAIPLALCANSWGFGKARNFFSSSFPLLKNWNSKHISITLQASGGGVEEKFELWRNNVCWLMDVYAYTLRICLSLSLSLVFNYLKSAKLFIFYQDIKYLCDGRRRSVNWNEHFVSIEMMKTKKLTFWSDVNQLIRRREMAWVICLRYSKKMR
jgi:hypothetical protein